MSFTEKQKKQIEKCLRNKVEISDDDIRTCIRKPKPKKSKKISSGSGFLSIEKN
jgi:hypothetical protein